MRRLFLMATLALATALPALAESPIPIQRNNLNSIWFENWIGLSNAMLRVATPDGRVTTEFKATRSPVYRLSGNRIVDGVYRYELRAATNERIPLSGDELGDQAEDGESTLVKPFYRFGAFLVENGVIVTPGPQEEEREAE